MSRIPRAIALLVAFLLPTLSVEAAASERESIDPAGVQRLATNTGARVSISPATGAARFVRLDAAKAGSLSRGASPTAALEDQAAWFFEQYGSIFGIKDTASELRLDGAKADGIGGTHVSYRQFYQGVPVFAGILRAHFDGKGRLRAVNGTFVPTIAVDARPSRTASQAARAALAEVRAGSSSTPLAVRGNRLYVYRTGLAQGVKGESHLVYEVEVGNGGDVREFVYVDAHTGKRVDRITGVEDAMFRRAYDGKNQVGTVAEYPNTPWWQEGNPFPTTTGNPTCVQDPAKPDCNSEANNMITSSKETYDLFNLPFLRDSFDNAGAKMDAIFDRGSSCPNASWNTIFISFCPGVTTDDVTAHEWGHAYTDYTHDLIYAWQPGALNEAYSDIWGETVDLINGRGTDAPGGNRTDATCSDFIRHPVLLTVNAPGNIAGDKAANYANFGPPLTPTGITGDVVLAIDGVGDTNDGCTAITNGGAVLGNIALINRGTCGFVVKVKNAQNAGAIAAIITNVAGGSQTFGVMGGSDATITIPSELIQQVNGDAIKVELAVPNIVNVTMKSVPPGVTDNSYKWLMGEDATAFGGAIRDMWNPVCLFAPGKVSDAEYFCGTADQGGVHTNSGVPNHGYALITDGGTYNAQTVAGIGLTKAAHIYFRAMSVYQVSTSDFTDHADALDASCTDLIGVNLADLSTGAPSGQMISAGDCTELGKAELAVELRTAPTQCGFQPLLAQSPPPLCGPGTTQSNLFFDNMEAGAPGWTTTHTAVTPADFTNRDWVVDATLPGARVGSAFFAVDDPNLGDCSPGGDESGALHLESPAITIPEGATTPLLSFDHYVATEADYDGGNLSISVNGGAYTLVDSPKYTYNAYNATLLATNPLAGQAGFSGSDGGSVEGTWGRSLVDLTGLAAPGDTIKLRWDFGCDGCGGNDGWYLDDVTVYACPSSTPPALSIDDASPVIEGDSGSIDATFRVSLSGISALPVTVSAISASGSATQGTDFTGVNLFLTFPPLTLTQTVTVPVLADLDDESDENFFVNLSGELNATVADGQGEGTIIDDDPKVSIGDVTVVEGSGGAVNAVFTVSLSAGTGLQVTVDYTTANGTATTPADYTSSSGTVTFAPLSTIQTISVPITGDYNQEPLETFFVNLSNAVNTAVADGQGKGTIVDNDTPTGITINDVAVTEGTPGATLTVSLTRPVTSTVTVDFVTANGTAAAFRDYKIRKGRLTFAPGTTAQTVTVPIVNDLVAEGTETFSVNLSNATNSRILDRQGVCTITDND